MRRAVTMFVGGGAARMQTCDPSDHLFASRFGYPCLGDSQPVPKHYDPMRDPEDVLEVVADDHDAETFRGKSFNEPETAALLRHTKVVGRLVQDYQLFPQAYSAGDRDRLALTSREILDRSIDRLQGDVEPVEVVDRLSPHGSFVEADRPPPARRERAEDGPEKGWPRPVDPEQGRDPDELPRSLPGVSHAGNRTPRGSRRSPGAHRRAREHLLPP